MTPNPIHRSHHPAAPLTEATEWPYDLRTWIGYMLQANGVSVETRIWLINERGKASSDVWNAARKARAMK